MSMPDPVSMEFINREGLEKGYNVKLPIFYRNETIEKLNNLKSSIAGSSNSTNRHLNAATYNPAPIKINIDNSTTYNASAFSFADFSTRNVVVQNNNNNNNNNNNVSSNTSRKTKDELEKEKKEEADRKQRQIIGFLSTALILVGSYLVGGALGTLNDINEDIKDLESLKKLVKKTRNQKLEYHNSNYALSEKHNEILHRQLEIVEEIVKNDVIPQMKKNAQVTLGLRIGFVASGIFGLVGAVAGVNPLMIVAGIGFLSTSCLTLGNVAYKYFGQKRFDRKTAELKGKIETMLTVLNSIPKTSMLDIAQYAAQIKPEAQSFSSDSYVYYCYSNQNFPQQEQV